MYKTDDVSNKLKCLTNTLRDTSENLKSLDYLVINPVNESRQQQNFLPLNGEKSSSLYKIEQSLDNISTKQNCMEDEIKKLSNSRNEVYEMSKFSNYSKPLKYASTNFLDSIEPYAEATFSVNKKLQDAQNQLANERISLANRNSSFNKTIDISPDLKSALTQQSSNEKNPIPTDLNQIESMTKRIIKSESDHSSLKFEYDSLKRQLLNEVGTKNSLMNNIENSKSKIYELEEQCALLKKESDRLTVENDVNKKKAETNTKWQEKLTAMQWENDQLKRDSRHCNHPVEIEELRRQKEKAERSKATMKDQMSEMTKQMDSKQSHISKLMDEIRDLQEKLSMSNMKYQDLDEKYQDIKNELRHRQKLYEDVVNKLDSLEHSMIEVEVSKNKGFSIRDDSIERLENQCSRYKVEIDKLNSHNQENSILMNDLHKDNESLRAQLMNGHVQIDALRREMESLIKARSIQDEILKRKEEENERFQNSHKDLTTELENTEKTCEKYKFDSEIYSQELNETREKLAIQEDRVANLSSNNSNLQDQLALYRSDISNQTRKTISLESQINNLDHQLNEYKNREENVEILRRQLEDSKSSKEKMTVDIKSKSKKFELEKENDLKKLEQMLDAERAALKVVLTKCDRQVLEINRLHQEYWSREQLVQRFRKKYVKVKQDLDNLIKQKEVDKNLQQNFYKEEIIEQEQEVKCIKEKLSDLMEERDQTIRWIILDIDGIAELLSQIDVFSTENCSLKASSYFLKHSSIDLKSCPPTSSALSTLGGLDMSKCLIDIKSKVSWVRTKINQMTNHLENYRNTIMESQQEISIANERIKSLTDEKQFLKNTEIEEARKCIAKLRVKEKNETNLQLKCERLQQELSDVREYLNEKLVDSGSFNCQKCVYH